MDTRNFKPHSNHSSTGGYGNKTRVDIFINYFIVIYCTVGIDRGTLPKVQELQTINLHPNNCNKMLESNLANHSAMLEHPTSINIEFPRPFHAHFKILSTLFIIARRSRTFASLDLRTGIDRKPKL